MLYRCGLPNVQVSKGTQTTFGYLQELGPGDLFVSFDTNPKELYPREVHYTLSELSSTGVRLYTTPSKKALQGPEGVFYVVSRAGDCGQPGSWCVDWEAFFWGTAPSQILRQDFLVT